MKKITDTGTYRTKDGQHVSISYKGRSDEHNKRRHIQNNSKYSDTGQGNGMEDLYAIMDKYNIKGFEFGNWVTQEERAEYVAAIIPTLEDLVSVVKSRNIGIDKNVGLAFGARGSGKAIAHYEPVLNMINITREHGAGSLAHEYGHALDYNLGAFVDRNAEFTSLSGSHSTATSLPRNTGGQLRAITNQIVDSICNGKNYAIMAKTPGYGVYWFRRTEIFARFFEQYVCYKLYSRNIHNRLLTKAWSRYTSHFIYVDKDDFMKILPVADKLMSEIAKFMNNTKGHRLRPTAYPKPVIATPKKEKKKQVKTETIKKAASLKNRFKAYEKKYGKLAPTSGRAKRIIKRTDDLFKKK